MDELKRRFTDANSTGSGNLNLSGLKITVPLCSIFPADDLGKIRSLTMYNNQVTTLPDNFFASLSNLEKMDISFRKLIKLPDDIFVGVADNLRELDMNCATLVSLPDNLFAPFKKLERINATWNSLIRLPDDIFASDALSNLQSITLSCSSLITLREDTFANKSLVNLKTLSINDTQLKTLPDNIFASNNLINLQILNICNNMITVLPENLFANKALTSLKYILISNTNLTALPENLFANKVLSNLQSISIINNYMSTLPDNIFANDALYNLKSINLFNSGLTTLPANIFANKALTGLEEIILNNNRLTELPETIFVNNALSTLQKLDFFSNQLITLPDTLFSNSSMTNLKILNLGYNKLSTLPDNIFNGPITRNLRQLTLYNNKLTTLPSSILACRRLHTFQISGNELTPDIRIQRFMQRMNNYANHGIFGNGQNVHASSIQTSTKQSINTLFKDSFDCSKDDIIKECLTWATPCLPDLLSYLDDTDVHSTLLVSFYDVFVKVFGRIMSHPNKTDIISRLDEELKESECKCFTGRLTRLVNCLVGFYDDIVIGISDSERISTIILSTLDGNEMDDELRKVCIDKLKDIDISDEEIAKWIS